MTPLPPRSTHIPLDTFKRRSRWELVARINDKELTCAITWKRVLAAIILLLYLNGNILVFTTPPIQVCIGWPDDSVYSWVCTPDYTARLAPQD